MKIALVGTSGSGKTALATELHRKLELPLIPESIRTASKILGLEGVRELDRDTRIMLQTLALNHQIIMESLHAKSGFITDRSRYEYEIHFKVFFGRKTPACDAYLNMSRNSAIQYDHIFYVPPFSRDLEDDSFRFIDNNFLKVEKEIEKYFYKLDTYKLKCLSLQNRVQEIMDKINLD